MFFGRQEKRRETRPVTVWVSPLDVKRIVVDGREIWARRIINVTDEEVVYEDPAGIIRTMKRVRPEKREAEKKKRRLFLPLTL